MNILIINQHTSNHGDEAAGKALLRELRDINDSNYKISILYKKPNLIEIEKLNVNNETHIDVHFLNAKDKIILAASLFLPMFMAKTIISFSKCLNEQLSLIEKNDLIINAPGGVNIGPYKDWGYLWRLYIALKMKKKVGIYSISFGPIPNNIFFKIKSRYVLQHADFLSLRDKRSQQYADMLELNYYPSIDTAFLSKLSKVSMPNEYANIKDYVVIVPNQLYKWHPNFKDINGKQLDSIYINIINYFYKKQYHIVLLPQLFGSENDMSYFKYLKSKADDNAKISIIDDTYNSDIQQLIISRSKFLVGARYHSIIFSINNCIPFVSLAYEHKMTNTLELLSLNKLNIDLKDILNMKYDYISCIDNIFENKNEYIHNISKAGILAQEKAKKTFKVFCNKCVL